MASIDAIELGGLQSNSLTRWNTLEKQQKSVVPRQWQRFNPWRSAEATELDAAARLITAAAKEHAVGSSFIKDFNHLYRRPDKTLLHNVGLSVSCPDSASLPEPKVGSESCLQDWCNTLHSVSVHDFADAFLLFECTARARADNAARGYKLLHISPSRVLRMREVAQRASLLLLSEPMTWNVSPGLVDHLNESPSKVGVTCDIALPSQRQEYEEHFRPSRGNAPILLMWQSHAPQYKNDLDTYIWQSFGSPPKSDYASISINDDRAPRNVRMILILKDEASMRDFREQRKIIASQTESWSATSELTFALHTLLSLATSGLVRFIEEAWISIGNTKFEARRRPSVEKSQYLLHLKDCVESGKSDVRHNLLQLKEIDQYLSGLASLNPEAHHVTFRKQLYQDDFIYLQTSLEKLGEGIDRLQTEIEGQSALRSRNTTMLTFLVAVYVPLAFVTSFLGMNISDPRPSKNSNDPPSAKIWNMKWFAYLAAPLLFVTIILPILAGPIFRQLLQWYIRLRNFWRVGFIIFWILFTVMTYVSVYCLDLYSSEFLSIYDGSIMAITTGRVYFAFKAVRSRQGGKRHLALSLVLLLGAIFFLMLDLDAVGKLILGTLAWIALPAIMFYEYRLDARNVRTRTINNESPN